MPEYGAELTAWTTEVAMNTPDDLQQLLREWRDVPADAPELAACVKEELERRAAVNVRWWRGANLGFGEHWPRFAAACVAIGLVIGVAGVEWRRARDAREMPVRYVRWIAPASFAGNTDRRP